MAEIRGRCLFVNAAPPQPTSEDEARYAAARLRESRAENARLKDALRVLAIRPWPNREGADCALCNMMSEYPERHAPGCLAALPQDAGGVK